LWGRGGPLHPLSLKKTKKKELKMKKYFVIDFKKVHDDAEYKNVVVGHNARNRRYRNRINIDPNKTKNNIVLVPLQFKSEKEIRDFAKKHLAPGKRQLQKNKAFAFNIVVDCSVMEGWTE
jgi:pyruvate-formate lyase-activating enzyme